MKVKDMYTKPIRHGDVDLIPVNEIPDNVKIKKDNEVMHGENGHSHILVNGELFTGTNGRKFIKSNNQTYLIHEEHKKTLVPEGLFEVMQEQEFDPFTEQIRRVRD